MHDNEKYDPKNRLFCCATTLALLASAGLTVPASAFPANGNGNGGGNGNGNGNSD